MKKLATVLTATMLLFFASCSDNASNEDGSDQVKEPVMNSGPETEGERATDAVSDSANAGSDSTIHHNSDAQSVPH
jgi:hypothetical protein